MVQQPAGGNAREQETAGELCYAKRTRLIVPPTCYTHAQEFHARDVQRLLIPRAWAPTDRKTVMDGIFWAYRQAPAPVPTCSEMQPTCKEPFKRLSHVNEMKYRYVNDARTEVQKQVCIMQCHSRWQNHPSVSHRRQRYRSYGDARYW